MQIGVYSIQIQLKNIELTYEMEGNLYVIYEQKGSFALSNFKKKQIIQAKNKSWINEIKGNQNT